MEIKQFCIDNGIPVEELGDIGEVSDGFHTFNSLYHQRLILFATLVNAFPTLAWKSRKHNDGEVPFGGGWFVVGIHTPAGQYTYHYEEKDWDLFRCKELERAPEWDGHTDKDVERLLSLVSPDENEMSRWAEEEINLAIESEKKSAEGTDNWEYGVACYESAIRAFRSLCRDRHSGTSIQITKSILNRLIDGKCLTPIEDTDDVWNELTEHKDGTKEYQCRRMSSLFKKVAPDGTVTYTDINRVSCIDISNPGIAYRNSFATRLVEKIFPMEMPYLAPPKPYKVFTEELLFGDKGDFDTIAYLYILLPDGQKIDLNRYFKEDESGQLVPMEKEEWNARKTAKKAEANKEETKDD